MSSDQLLAKSIYRAIYRAAGQMPSRDRKNYVRKKLREEYELCRTETNPERIAFYLRLGQTQLETVQLQVKHLSSTFSSPQYHRE